jgi:hypothetical protein
MRNAFNMLVRKSEGNNHLEDIAVERKTDRKVWIGFTGFTWLRICTSGWLS